MSVSSVAGSGSRACSLLTQAGDVTLQRDPISGRVDTVAAGAVTETYGCNDYGEITSKLVTLAGSLVLLDVTYTRDDLGRIEHKSEQVDQDPVLELDYEYDEAGRLRKVYNGGSAIEYGRLSTEGGSQCSLLPTMY